MSRVAAITGDWAGVVVVYGDTPWDGHSHVDQRVASGLSNHAPVLYVDPPSTWHGRRRGVLPGRSRVRTELRVVQPSLVRLTPHFPPGSPSVRRAVSASVTARAVRRALVSLGSPNVAASVSFGTKARPAVEQGEIRVLIVRDQTLLPNWWDTRNHSGAVKVTPHIEADLVVATSPALAEELDQFDPLLLPYGCDHRALADVDDVMPAPDVLLDHPVAGFVGALTRRVDVELLREVVERDVSLLLVGPCGRPANIPGLDELLRHPLVGWVGPRAPNALGPYFRVMDVGLIAYTESELNQLTFPSKTLDYLAAGRPVVSTDLSSARWLQARQRSNVEGVPSGPMINPNEDLVIASGPDAFADAVARLAVRERPLAAVERRRAFARYHGWDQRMAVLAARLELAKRGLPAPVGRRAVPPVKVHVGPPERRLDPVPVGSGPRKEEAVA